MASRPIWKHPDDILYRDLGFERVFPAGVTISGTPTYDVSPSGALTAIHQAASGQTATVKLQLGTALVDYVVTCIANASNGEKYNRAVTVKVRTGI